jgi:GntR family transcriptional regulator/MocR family aminotransferase
MKKYLEEKLGNSVEIITQSGGLAILINPTAPFSWDKLEILAKQQKIKLHYAKERCGDEWQALMMGFAGLKEEEIEPAINLFSQIWHKCLKN